MSLPRLRLFRHTVRTRSMGKALHWARDSAGLRQSEPWPRPVPLAASRPLLDSQPSFLGNVLLGVELAGVREPSAWCVKAWSSY